MMKKRLPHASTYSVGGGVGSDPGVSSILPSFVNGTPLDPLLAPMCVVCVCCLLLHPIQINEWLVYV